MAKKLLVADDSVTIQKVVQLTFAGEDVAIEAVSSGDQAVEKARALRPDMMLADVYMPGLNGYEVCSSIKADAELAGTPVVLLVGTFEPFDEAEAARVRSDGHLTKPFDTSELIQLVRSLIDTGCAGKPERELPRVGRRRLCPPGAGRGDRRRSTRSAPGQRPRSGLVSGGRSDPRRFRTPDACGGSDTGSP